MGGDGLTLGLGHRVQHLGGDLGIESLLSVTAAVLVTSLALDTAGSTHGS